MTVTTLDPITALVVVDLQKGLANYPTAHPMAGVVGNSAALARSFRAHGLPVVLVNVDGVAPGRTEQGRRGGSFPDSFAEFMEELGREPGDHVVTKKTWGAFSNTDLNAHLRALGVTQVVVTGVATSAGVESTARQAHELGFNVALASDAMTDMSAEAHENSLTRIFPRMAEVGTTAEIAALLNGREGQA